MRNRYAIAGLAGALLLVGCGSSGSSSPGVPALSQAAGHTSAGSQTQGSPSQGSPSQGASAQAVSAQGAWAGRGAELHAAAQCIRQHGIPSYQDPVLTASGQVYTDSRSLDDAPQSVIDAVQQACGALAARPGQSPDAEPPAPPPLVQAGVRSAECMRAHGLPNVQDPTAQSSYTPGHGFGYSSGEIPAGGKTDPVYQAAAHACRALLDAEVRASTLANLGNDG
jgi:hypothetical protein